MSVKQIKVSRIFKELYQHRKVARVVSYGGTRSGKTYSALQYLVRLALESKNIIRIYKSDGASCKKNIAPDLVEILAESYGILEEVKINKTDGTFTFQNGSVIFLDGTSDPHRLRGLKQDVAFLNECTDINDEAHTQISYRTSKQILYDFNPSTNIHWIWDIIAKEASHTIRSTYKDNPYLTPSQIENIEMFAPTLPDGSPNPQYDEYRWSVYGLGEKAVKKGRIYNFVEPIKSTDFFPSARQGALVAYGLDFGFSNDESALIECALYQDTLYVRELMYEKELLITKNVSNSSKMSIQHYLEQELSLDDQIYADSARPEAISDLATCGYNIRKVSKGHGSLLNGIRKLQEIKIKFVNSHNLAKEFENYCWGFKRDGTATGQPIDKHNHLLDAMRYCYVMMSGDYLYNQHSRYNNRPRSKKRYAGGTKALW